LENILTRKTRNILQYFVITGHMSDKKHMLVVVITSLIFGGTGNILKKHTLFRDPGQRVGPGSTFPQTDGQLHEVGKKVSKEKSNNNANFL
jgi:hypothetical protein